MNKMVLWLTSIKPDVMYVGSGFIYLIIKYLT